jgi:hypothetical protein
LNDPALLFQGEHVHGTNLCVSGLAVKRRPLLAGGFRG